MIGGSSGGKRLGVCKVCGGGVVERNQWAGDVEWWSPAEHCAPCGAPCIGGGVRPKPHDELSDNVSGIAHAHRKDGCGVAGCAGGKVGNGRLHLVQALTPGMADALESAVAERARQDEKWGQLDHPMVSLAARRGFVTADVAASAALLPTAARAREHCNHEHRTGKGTFFSILVEEVAEAFEACVLHGEASDQARKELVQVVAVGIAMIESVDRARERLRKSVEAAARRHADAEKNGGKA